MRFGPRAGRSRAGPSTGRIGSVRSFAASSRKGAAGNKKPSSPSWGRREGETRPEQRLREDHVAEIDEEQGHVVVVLAQDVERDIAAAVERADGIHRIGLDVVAARAVREVEQATRDRRVYLEEGVVATI